MKAYESYVVKLAALTWTQVTLMEQSSKEGQGWQRLLSRAARLWKKS